MDKHALETYARLAQIRDTLLDVVQGVAMPVAFVLLLALVHTIELKMGG